MRSLERLQKLCGIFKIVTLIAAILSFVGVYLNVMISAILLVSGRFGILDRLIGMFGSSMGGTGYTLMMPFVSAGEIAPRLISNIIGCSVSGILFISAMHCFSAEISEGTPFSHRLADEVRALGVKTIVFPIVGIIAASIVYACFGTLPTGGLSNNTSIVIGVCLILLSLILRCGAEMCESTENIG